MKIIPPFNIISNSKNFSEPLIGSPALNQVGLHVARVRAAASCAALRRMLAKGTDDADMKNLAKDGYVAVENFLPNDQFSQVSAEVEGAIASAEQAHPLKRSARKGFGAKQPFEGGFDRFDGGTLNRFLDIDPGKMPETDRAAYCERLNEFSREIVGMPMPRSKVSVYLTVQGDEDENPDDQRVFHRDTFFPCVKFWYFLREVKLDDGPFVFVPGSHRLNPKRLRWEKQKSVLSAEDPKKNGGGAFRIDPSLFDELELEAPRAMPVPANTLVIANTFGFHRRGDARPWSQRLAIFGQLRPYAFSCYGR